MNERGITVSIQALKDLYIEITKFHVNTAPALEKMEKELYKTMFSGDVVNEQARAKEIQQMSAMVKREGPTEKGALF